MKLIILFLIIFIGILITTNYYVVEGGPYNRGINISRGGGGGGGGFVRIGENRFNDRGVNISSNVYTQNSYCGNNPQSTLCR